MRKTRCHVGLLVLWLSVGLLAHDGHVHHTIMGVVQSVAKTQIVITATDGTRTTLALNEKTKFLRGTRTVAASELRAGERVAVGVATAKEPYVAVDVRLASSSPGGKLRP